MKVEMAVLVSPRSVAVDVKQHWRRHERVQELCEIRGGHPGPQYSSSPYSNIEKEDLREFRRSELCESRGGRPGLPSLIGYCNSESVRCLWT